MWGKLFCAKKFFPRPFQKTLYLAGNLASLLGKPNCQALLKLLESGTEKIFTEKGVLVIS